MATIASSSAASEAQTEIREPALFGDIAALWRQFFARAFDPYRPELHYMRGPGPAWRARQTAASRQRSN
jgi:hypothetical protein